MEEIRTHKLINRELCGTPEISGTGKARVTMKATGLMSADEQGLIHGGFVFGMADYAAMLAVNDPFVVLAASDCRFIKPCRTGDLLTAEAEVTASEGKKRSVQVCVFRGKDTVFTGTFSCAVLQKHVLD